MPFESYTEQNCQLVELELLYFYKYHKKKTIFYLIFPPGILDYYRSCLCIRFRKKGIIWVGGVYRDGRVDADIQELGSYSVRADSKAPTITPLNAANWLKRNRISLKLSDNLSGVESYRGEIDGKYALFEMNNRSVISYTLDRERLTKGAHVLRVTATDACGNESEYTYHFTW